MKKFVLTLIVATCSFCYMNAQVSAYSFAQTSGTYTPITGGTVLGSITDDEQSFVDPTVVAGGTTKSGVGLPIGFSFTYNGIVFDKFAINTNGWISLGQSTLTPSVNLNSSSYLTLPLSQTSTAVPALLRNRIGAIAMDLVAQTGSSLMIKTTGVAPNRICVIQWTNYKKYLATSGSYNFQIHLKETSNTVEIVYGTCTSSTTIYDAQVGLSGTTAADFNIRKTTTSWASSTAGTLNTDTCRISATVIPASGQTYTWTVPPACTGTPTAGTASAPTAICSGVNFDLTLTGYTPNVSGLTFQWQSASSIGGTYTNITNGTTPTFTTSQTATTYYKCIVTCGGSPAASNIVTVTLNNPSACYCTPVHSSACSSSDNIDSVRIVSTTLANLHTGCTGTNGTAYTIYPATGNTTATLTGGNTYTFKVTTTTSNIVSVWIDYNQNGTYDASEWTQICTTSTANTPNTASVVIPASALAGVTGMRIRSRASGNSNGSADPCTSFASGETEDYKVTIIAATPCSGTPTAGVASASVTSVCSAISFNLILTGYTSGVSGLTFQWQSSSSLSGTYTNIVGATTPTYAASETATTYYHCIVTCSGSPATSNAIGVTLNTPSNCYCTPPSTNCSLNDVITNVTVSTINNTTTCSTNGYSAYTTPVPTLYKTIATPISVTVGSGGTEYVAVWIDYNQNGTFDSTEFTSIGNGNGVTISSTITVPSTALAGATKMRVRVRYGTALTGSSACIGYNDGETEDYSVTIGTATACSGAPTPGTASASTDSICTGTNFDLILSGYTQGVSGLTFQWQSSSTLSGTYTNISGATTPTFTTSETATTFYHCIVTCSGTSATSTAVEVYLTPLANCYCVSAATSTSDEDILNVTVGSLNNTSTCLTTGGTGSILNEYSNYKTVAAPNLARSSSVPFSVQIGTCGTGQYKNAFKIYIDYNQNGSFTDAGETVYRSDTTKGPHTNTGNFTVPANAVLGNTLMRVVNKETSDTSSIVSCGTYGYGETEDYLVNITSVTGVEENNIGNNLTIYPNPTTGMFNITMSDVNFTELLITIFDIQGKEVYSAVDKNISSNYNKQINLEGLAKGLYYIKLNSNKGVKVQKLIID